MNKLILSLYGYFRQHRGVMAFVLLALTVCLVLLAARIHYKEDITDFLPFDGNQQEAMRMYQELSGANRIIAIIGARDSAHSDPDRIAEAADAYADAVGKTGVKVSATVDLDQMSDVAGYVYKNIPYFLTPADYARMDSLLARPGYVGQQLSSDMETLMFPSGGLFSANIGKDPLNLFTPVVEKLSKGAQSMNYELYDGHVFTPDMKNAIIIIESPYGSSETEDNGRLVERLHDCGDTLTAHYADMSVRLTGGPVIAVGNSDRIKADSLLSIGVAVVLILALLALAFRSWRNIALIALTIAWGWLFALGCLSLVHDTVSLIVIGISSVIIGIAVNYPLHLIAHLNHTPDMRRALREIVEPLLVGNITTIGAFLTLVPLKSVALRDLGLFAAFLLIGTIFFVFAFLPHFVKVGAAPKEGFFNRLGNVRLEDKRWLVATAAVLTVVFAFYSTRTSFDSDVSHINYMTDGQKADMSYLSAFLRSNAGEKTIYAVASGSTADEAVKGNEAIAPAMDVVARQKGVRGMQPVTQFLPSGDEQARRLRLWKAFVARHAAVLNGTLRQEAARSGFSDDSFNDFFSIIGGSYRPREVSFFRPLTDGPLRRNVFHDTGTGTYSIVTPVTVSAGSAAAVSERLGQELSKRDVRSYCFEIGELNNSIANSLSDNFNYIGWACGFIVFFFLWLSFGNIELAALSFLPMAVSWLWILGLMSMFGIQFNIINIILATFIFGQGDDYTIFMTEGCQYEYAYGRKMLASYKNSIIISALIMFIGMGVLVLARHPALRSLGQVTVVGMFSVVLMAYLLPPFVFRWMVSSKGRLRKRPLTLRSLLMPGRYPQDSKEGQPLDYYRRYVGDAYYYCGSDIVRTVRKDLKDCTAIAAPAADGCIEVGGGSYGAVALVMALANPTATVCACVDNDDDEAVCRNVACRIADNIKIRK